VNMPRCAASESPHVPRSLSCSRSPSEPQGSRSPGGSKWEVISIESDDAAFIHGKVGVTKRKLEHVSGARIEVCDDLKLELYGTDEERQKARDYCNFVMAQRRGAVYIDFDQNRSDMSVVIVPESCVAYIMGKGGKVLRSLEEQWGTLMFFAQCEGKSGSRKGEERLAIFGPRRGRRGAELKVMSAVEHKCLPQGHFVEGDGLANVMNQPGDNDDSDGTGWGYRIIPLGPEDFSYALGSRGSTRKKLAAASRCIIEYVGHLAIIAGTRAEQRRGHDYLSWLIMQRQGPVVVACEGRDDVTTLEVPRASIGFITGHRGETLRRIEQQTDTFCFADGEKSDSHQEVEHEMLMIFGHDHEKRTRALRIVEDKIKIHQGDEEKRRRVRDRSRSRDRGRQDRDRGRGRDDNRGRRYSRSRDKGRRDDRGRRNSRSPPRRRYSRSPRR